MNRIWLFFAALMLCSSAAFAQETEPATPTKMTESYARMVARNAYFWAWPMVNIYNRRLAFQAAPEIGLMNGVLPFAPPNRMSMLHDYIEPSERWVACPNQDTVYGAGVATLEQTPVVVQVPDFGKRFWVYQIVDLRTDSFADLGAMYDSKPGFYLIVGPNWKEATPKGITKVFRSKTNTAFVVPRLFQDDTAEDRKAVQSAIAGIDMYPLAEFNGKMKTRDWSKLPRLGSPAGEDGAQETQWVFPERFFDQLPDVLRDAPALAGEQANYDAVLAVIAAAKADPALKKAIVDEATKTNIELIKPLLQFRNFGLVLPGNWSTVNNGAQFGMDYFSRTAVAKSNILVNKANETKYYYLDLDAKGARLNSQQKYRVTFAKGELPPVNGFWSLTLYSDEHFFVENPIKRYSIGTKNKSLKTASDGSLTLYIQPDEPSDPVESANWLPAPKGSQDFSLYMRLYWPKPNVLNGSWTPPSVVQKGE